jgi:hypothetical protein
MPETRAPREVIGHFLCAIAARRKGRVRGDGGGDDEARHPTIIEMLLAGSNRQSAESAKIYWV